MQKAAFKLLFNLLRGRTDPKLPGPVWKSKCPLNLITDYATLGSITCNQVFKITDDQLLTLLWRNFVSLIFAKLFEFNHIGGFLNMNGLFKVMHLNLISDFYLTTPNPSFCFFWAIQTWTCWCFLYHCPAVLPKSSWASGQKLRQRTGREQNAWFHQLQQIVQVLEQQRSSRSSHYHRHVWLLVWCSVYKTLTRLKPSNTPTFIL